MIAHDQLNEVDRRIPAVRIIPVNSLNVTATSSGTAQTLFSMGEFITEVIRLTVTNTTGSAATLTLHVVPESGTIGSGNMELSAYSVAANTTLRIDELLGAYYPPNSTIQVFSGTNGALNVRGGVREWR